MYVRRMDTSGRLIHQFDQYDTWLRETIRRCGWALQAVLGDEEGPPFVYTVGLSGFGHAELVLFGTSQATAAAVLNDLGDLVRAGRVLAAGQTIGLRNGLVHLLPFPESADWLFAANQLYRSADGPPVPALLVIPEDELVPEPGADRPCACCGP
jgi:Domain of unknown function (DUF4262)